MHKNPFLYATERLKTAFDYFDVDASDKIDVDELFAITGDMDEARRAMLEYDVDQDGEMDFLGKSKKVGRSAETWQVQKNVETSACLW